MEDTTTTADKSIVDQLDFGARTTKRVEWEAFEFTITGPHQVEVVNASCGFEKGEHAYTVGIAEREGVAVPVECSCPADIHREPDCKHKVALATVGGSTVLEAALAYDDSPPLSRQSPESTTTVAEKIETDGGEDTCPNGSKFCDGANGDVLPCFPCMEAQE